jgi:hypothetical protein
MKLRRFHATAELNATRIARDAVDISEAIIQHLAALWSEGFFIPRAAPENNYRGLPPFVVEASMRGRKPR